MYTSELELDVRYYETDQMGIVHHSNYIRYFECGRSDMMAKLGVPVDNMESEQHIMFPIVSIDVHYKAPAKFGEKIKVVTTLTKWPLAKFIDEQKVFNEHGELLSYATVVIGVINSITRKPARVPRTVLEKLVPYYPKEDQIGL
ncbi:MAG TPA: thioesterase family protein [Candidatus Egerieousia sp.]|nr:thioesterase family protein [Candidatus Egerieousia sp.]HPT05656.1 thioesterase family protein [Candidatus Egerieousia sp.]